MCDEQGYIRGAAELDHIKQHKGDPSLFWSLENLQGLCKYHHRTIKARMERGVPTRGCRQDGSPLDPDHPWNE